jgi:hypothetical protein
VIKKLTEKQLRLIKRSAHLPVLVRGEWRWGANPGSIYVDDARVYRPLIRAGLIEGTYSFVVTAAGFKAAGLENLAALSALVRFFGRFCEEG